jgi:LAO/AO transport system kinase
MRDLAGDAGVFIRSMASRGSLGGLARATFDVVQLMDAAGFDRILVETVGAGQAEVEIAGAAHTTIVVEAPGMGDEVQAFKAGLLEIADILVVNKADRSDADRTVLALQAMQSLGPSATVHHHLAGGEMPGPGHRADGSWLPPIVKTVAVEGGGIAAVRDWAEEHARYLRETNGYASHERRRAVASIRHILDERLPALLLARLPEGYWDRVIQGVVSRNVAPHVAVEELLRAGNWLG